MSGTGKVISNENRQRKILEPEVKGEVLKNDNIYAVVYGPAGDDSRPLPADSFVFVENENVGGKVAAGFLDTQNDPVSGDGERRLYSRNSSGTIKAIIFLKDDGTLEINNGSDFAVRFNALQAAFDELKAAFNTHTHVYSPGALTPITTAIPVPQSLADISLSKIDEINVP